VQDYLDRADEYAELAIKRQRQATEARRSAARALHRPQADDAGRPTGSRRLTPARITSGHQATPATLEIYFITPTKR